MPVPAGPSTCTSAACAPSWGPTRSRRHRSSRCGGSAIGWCATGQSYRHEPYVACRELHEIVPSGLPVVVLVAEGCRGAALLAAGGGVVDYVVKPFEPVELRARIQAALRTKSALDHLHTLVWTDDRTGVGNHRYLDALATAMLALAARHDHQVSCLMMDLDHFKQVNDTYG